MGEDVPRFDNESYLVSPNSKKWARQKISEEEEETERRCMHLYQECDRSYVERKFEAINSLRRKLGFG